MPTMHWRARTRRWLLHISTEPTTSTFGWPLFVDWLRRVRCNLHLRAVVIREITGIVNAVLGHELYDLERAPLAIDIGQHNVRFPEAVAFGCVDPQAIGEHRHLRRVLDFG